MNAGFGVDLGDVRVHTGRVAEASARALSPSVHHLRVCSAPPSNLALSEWTLVELADDFIMFTLPSRSSE